MAKDQSDLEVKAILSELLDRDHPENGCRQNTCDVCVVRKYGRIFAAADSFNSSFDSSVKFDSFFKKILPKYSGVIKAEYEAVFSNINSTKCQQCGKFVHEAELHDYECHNCGANLLSESRVSVFLKPIREVRNSLTELDAISQNSKRSGILSSLSRSIVQIIENNSWEITSDGLVRVDAVVVHESSQPVKESFFSTGDSRTVKVAKVSITPLKKKAG